VARLKHSTNGLDALVSGLAVRIAQNLVGGQALLNEVVAADTRLRKARVASSRSRGDDERSQASFLEVEGVIEAGFEDGRGLAVVLGGPEDDDRAGGRGLVERGLAPDGPIQPNLNRQEDGGGQEAGQQRPVRSDGTVQPINSFSCSRVTGPSRRIW